MVLRSTSVTVFSFFLITVLAGCGDDGASGSSAGASGSSASSGSGGASGGSAGGAGGAGVGGGATCLENSDGGIGDGGAVVCDGHGARFVTEVVSICFGPGDPDFMPTSLPGPVAGPPKGAGCCAGSLDVVSLGNGGSIVLAFHGDAIVDGPGPDFIVFENAFDVGGDPQKPYAELATVEVSDDGIVWTAFPCAATKAPYGACAGWRPVNANADMNQIDPLDPQTAGGDPFDLADVGVKQARFVRITDRADMPGDFDLDAVGIVNALCP